MSENGDLPISTEAAARRYADLIDRISRESIGELDALVTDDVHFRDPFNEVRGRERMKACFLDMYRYAREVRFNVREIACTGRLAFLLWDFEMVPKRGRKTWRIHGVSEVHFDQRGLITAHLDHWDSGPQLYAKLPVVGPLVRFVQGRLALRD